jgi:arabinogalactan endo-1,4-beta-galactosidase
MKNSRVALQIKAMKKLFRNSCVIFSIICLTLFMQKVNAQFANGSDVSWVTQMEASGVKFYNNSGTQADLFDILNTKCINAIRLRVWVNPAGGWCNKSDVVAKAIRAKNKGYRILIDFHYSDTWADPGHQAYPAAWLKDTSISALVADVAAHTTDVLDSLKANGITPEWVQVGNETNDGMLWSQGRASTHMNNFAALINSGYNAAKAVFPTTKVIVHISNGYDNTLFRWMFDGLKNNGAQWDVIGMSLYPSTTNWATLNTECLTNMNDMVSRYGKQVMIVEAGMSVSATAACDSFLTDIIKKTQSVSGGNGLGVFYWEPECYNNWQGYTMGAFDNTGKPTIAMNAFSNSCLPSVNITAPAGNSSFCAGTSITLAASASYSNGTISKVSFYDGATLLSTITAAPYSYVWTNAGTGTHSITAIATDNVSTSTTSSIVSITVNALPAAPTVTTPITYCQNATATTLTATGTALKWYTTTTGGTGSTTAPTPVTTSTGTTDYYVSQTVTGCEGPRATIAVTVNTLPSAPTVTTPVTYCQNATATALTGTGTALKWYTSAIGGTGSTTSPTPVTTSTGTTDYYVSQTVTGCEGPRATIAVTVNTLPSAPTVTTPVTYCQNATATALTGTGTALKWYTSATGGIGSTTAPTPTTTASGTTNYYVSQTTNSCEGPRASISVAIIPSVTWYQDLDGDGKGDPNVTIVSCTQPVGYVSVAGDGCPTDPNKIAPGNCGCGKTEQSCLDCAGVPNGTAAMDSCGHCVGGTTGLTACSITTGTIGNIAGTSIIVYPQPFENNTLVELKNGGAIESISIYSSTGALVYVINNINDTKIELGENLSEGLYTIIIQTQQGIYSTRIIKMK